MKQIQVSREYVALIDDEDYPRVSQFTWTAQYRRRRADGAIVTVYATTRRTRTHKELLHRFILGLTDPEIKVDHRDHNGLNNQRSNLRIATNHQNLCSRQLGCNNTSGFKGVFWEKQTGKWKAEVGRKKGTRRNLGRFDDKRDAAIAYDVAAIAMYGEFALTNAALGLL